MIYVVNFMLDTGMKLGLYYVKFQFITMQLPSSVNLSMYRQGIYKVTKCNYMVAHFSPKGKYK